MSLPNSATMTAPETGSATVENELLEYRSIHSLAVVGVIVGALSAVILLSAGKSLQETLIMSPIPIVGLIASLYALRSIASAPDVYSGAQMATAGAVLSAFFLVIGVGYSGYIHATEVPDGYNRTSFIAMKPTEQDEVDRNFIPVDIQEYITSGKPIFIKGFIRPDSIKFKQNLTDFLLVRDNNQCCFGDLSKVRYFDQIQVELDPGLTTDFNRGLFRVGGRLTIGPGDPEIQTPITYKLAADYVKP